MSNPSTTLGQLLRTLYPSVLAKVLRSSRDLASAEDTLQEAISRALQNWPTRGIPENPEAWLVRTARNIGIDGYRKSVRERDYQVEELAVQAPWSMSQVVLAVWDDEMLGLITTCCDPVLEIHEQVALTLSTVVGLSQQETAAAFCTSPRTIEQRLVRARKRLRERKTHYGSAEPSDTRERIWGVLQVLHLTFSEGHLASGGDKPIRRNLCELAFGLCRSLAALLPNHAETLGLLALMYIHQARMPARLDPEGWPLPLPQQDRSLWLPQPLAEGQVILQRAMRLKQPGPYQIEAAIADLHTRASSVQETDWPQITLLYQRLEEMRPSPVVTLNRAFATSRSEGAQVGLEILETVADSSTLTCSPYLYLVQAELLVELGNTDAAKTALHQAAEVASSNAAKREIQRRLDALS